MISLNIMKLVLEKNVYKCFCLMYAFVSVAYYRLMTIGKSLYIKEL
jgi:hypothetical protein